MILYVNGDSHSAGAEAAVPHAFAEDDPKYRFLGRIPHPANLEVSYGNVLANKLNADLHCDAESASSNSRIIRTTRAYIKNNTPDLIVIGWATWEREEWLCDGIYWQVNAGGIGHDWPVEIKEQYKEWIANIDYDQKTAQAHSEIYALHQELDLLGLPHVFFNCYSDFHDQPKVDWTKSYLDPYDPKLTYWQWLTDQGYKSNEWYHFAGDAHLAWANYLLTRLTNESIITL